MFNKALTDVSLGDVDGASKMLQELASDSTRSLHTRAVAELALGLALAARSNRLPRPLSQNEQPSGNLTHGKLDLGGNSPRPRCGSTLAGSALASPQFASRVSRTSPGWKIASVSRVDRINPNGRSFLRLASKRDLRAGACVGRDGRIECHHAGMSAGGSGGVASRRPSPLRSRDGPVSCRRVCGGKPTTTRVRLRGFEGLT